MTTYLGLSQHQALELVSPGQQFLHVDLQGDLMENRQGVPQARPLQWRKFVVDDKVHIPKHIRGTS